MTGMSVRWGNPTFTQHLAKRVWTASGVVRRYLHILASGSEDVDWWTSVAGRHAGDLDPLLVLGSGSGGIERLAAERGAARRVLACDLSIRALALAERERQAQDLGGVLYFACDLNRPDFPVRAVRAVISHDALHHLQELEVLFAELQRLLLPGGILAFCEYTGPNRFQYPDEQLALINEYLQRIPRHLRVHPDTGRVVEEITLVDPDVLAREDESEAVRSEAVVPAALERFEAVILKPYNGGLLNPLLHDIVVNFHCAEGREVLKYLCAEELRLTEAGELAPNFTLFEGRPK
jgi:SAM-dependent methyltransferase